MRIIKSVVTQTFTDGSDIGYVVGQHGVTKIEEFEKNGLHCDIPYIRVFRGEDLAAELCQHSVESFSFYSGHEIVDMQLQR